jgi:hypothetical protein
LFSAHRRPRVNIIIEKNIFAQGNVKNDGDFDSKCYCFMPKIDFKRKLPFLPKIGQNRQNSYHNALKRPLRRHCMKKVF